MENMLYVLYKMGTDSHTPTILGVFHETGQALEALDAFLPDYYDDVYGQEGCEEIGKEEYVQNVTEGIRTAQTFHDELLEETFTLELAPLGEIR